MRPSSCAMFTLDVEALRKLIRDETRSAVREVLAEERAAASTPTELLTIAEAAAALRIAPRTCRGYVACGRLASRLVGRRRLIARVDVEAFARGVDEADPLDVEVAAMLAAERAHMMGSPRTTPRSKSATNAGQIEQ